MNLLSGEKTGDLGILSTMKSDAKCSVTARLNVTYGSEDLN